MKTTTLFAVTILTFVILAITIPQNAGAAFDRVLSYQGRLTDTNGVPVADVPAPGATMTFKICTDSACTTVVWTEVHTTSVVIEDGLFSVVLGEATALPDFTSAEYYIQVTYGVPYSPPQRIVASAMAVNADLLDGHDTLYFQREITGTCAAGSAIRVVNDDGTVTCQTDAGATDHGALTGLADDDHTQYFALAQSETVTGKPSFNNAIPFAVGNTTLITSLNADLLDGQHSTYFQREITGTCAAGSSIRVVNDDGTVTCQTDAGATDHGALTGLADDDHTQYFALAQSETVTGIPAFNGGLTGTSAPFTVDSTFLVTNLNADLLDGQHSTYFQREITGTCAAGSSIRVVNDDGTVTCEADTGATDHGALTGLADDDHTQYQLEVTGTCAAGSSIRVIATDGTVTCEADTDTTDHGALGGLGDDDHTQYFALAQSEIVTGIPAFNGGVTGTSAPFTADSTFLVTNLNADLLDGQHGSYYAAGGHTHDTLTRGTGLTGSNYNGSPATTWAVDTSVIQARVSGTCAAGNSMRVINVDGTVTCEADTDTDTWITTQTCPLADYALSSVGKTTQTCINKVDYSDYAYDSDKVDGFHANQNRSDANVIVVRDANGYIQAGWINTPSGSAGTTAITKIYASYDDYIRYYTPANFVTVMDPYMGCKWGTNVKSIDGTYGDTDTCAAGYCAIAMVGTNNTSYYPEGGSTGRGSYPQHSGDAKLLCCKCTM
ncbi:MAG: hypothetical protein ABIH66_13820 [bacterium]